MFNKLFTLAVLAMTLSHAVDEFSSERLLGIEVGYAQLATKDAIGLDDTVQNIKFGFRLGAQNEDWRTTLIGDMSNANGHEYKKAILAFDKFVWQSLYKKDNIVFKPYLSGHVGWINHQTSSVTENGLLYGAGAGISWNVLREVDFDLGYRYSLTDLESLKSLSAVTLGVNYIY